MDYINTDQASTSSPKAKGVAEAMCDYIRDGGLNIARGQYRGAQAAGLALLDVRRRAARLFGSSQFRQLVFTANVTQSLNMVLKGTLKPGDHVLCSSMEHNAVMRPLTQLSRQGVSFDTVHCDQYGRLDPAALEAAIQANTRMLVLTAASNVCGTIMPLEAVGDICRRHDILYVVDSAQVAGMLPLDAAALGIDALCFTGHKSLGGPQGTGGILFSEQLSAVCEPLLSGGTGSFSESIEVPESMPDRFEAGTMNLPGLMGLGAALKQLEREPEGTAWRHAMDLTARFLAGVESMMEEKRIRLLGLPSAACSAQQPQRMAVVSLDFVGRDNGRVGARLEEAYGILTRTGLHCAPLAHRTLGSFPQGAVRFSFGRHNTIAEVETVLQALSEL